MSLTQIVELTSTKRISYFPWASVSHAVCRLDHCFQRNASVTTALEFIDAPKFIIVIFCGYFYSTFATPFNWEKK